MDANDAGPVIDETLSSNEIAGGLRLPHSRFSSNRRTRPADGDGAGISFWSTRRSTRTWRTRAPFGRDGYRSVGARSTPGGAGRQKLSVGGFQFTRHARDQTRRVARVTSDQRPTTALRGRSTAWRVRDVRLVLHDQSVSPQADLAAGPQRVDGHSAASDQEGLTPLTAVGALGVVESLQTPGDRGSVVFPGQRQPRSLARIRPDYALQPYLEGLGLESLYTGGTFSCDVNATFTNQPNEPIGASGAITNIHLQDTEELFGLKTIGVQGARIDPVTETRASIRLRSRTSVWRSRRDREGCLATLGFRLVGRTSEPAPHQAESMGQSKGPGPHRLSAHIRRRPPRLRSGG